MRARSWFRSGVIGGVLAAAMGLTAACSSGGSSSHPDSTGPSATVNGHIGDLTVSGAFIPQPPSPDVAAVYLTVHNGGGNDDSLTKVGSDVAAQVMPMTETESGATGEMTDLSSVVVPAHGQYAFTRGHAHLMLENPTRSLKQGQTVRLTLDFQHAGSVTLTVPVTSFRGPDDGGAMPDMPMPDMPMTGGSMSGMSGPSTP